MPTPRVYITGGTVSCANGDDFFTGVGTLFAQADLEGAQLLVFPLVTGEAPPIVVGVVEAIDPRYPEATYPNLGPIPLVHSYDGASIVTESRYVLALSPAMVASSTVSAMLARFVAHFEDGAGLVYTDSPDLDYALVEDGSIIIDATTRQIKRWKNGVLETIFAVSLAFSPQGPWVGDPESKFALTISTGDVAVDFTDGLLDAAGRAHFALTVNAAADLLPPTGVAVDDVFDILFTISGGPHALTSDAVYDTDISTLVSATAGARTRLRFTVTAETAGTATAVTVEAVTFALNDLVEDGGYLFVSNVAANDAEPDGTPGSDANWTLFPTTAGADGDPGSSDVTATSATSLAIATGSKAFTVVETDRGWAVGARLRASSNAAPQTNWMEGVITAYSGAALTILVDLIGGSGTKTDWTFNLAGEPGEVTGDISAAVNIGDNAIVRGDGGAKGVQTSLVTIDDAGLLTIPGQIKFPATANPSANANTLDDYEEGTWTPALTFATPGDLSVVHDIQTGSYTKIGRKVLIDAVLRTSTFTHTTASGLLRLTGLPFTPSAAFVGAGPASMRGYTKANFTQLLLETGSAVAYLFFLASGSAQSSTELGVADVPTATQKYIYLSGQFDA